VSVKVLIIEDDPIIADYLSQLLSAEGVNVLGIAHTGERALDKISSLHPDLCICDIHLGPGMSGIDVAEVLSSKYQIPYIFLTSFDDDKTIEEAERHSPYGYIVKPFQDRTLLATIKIAWSNYKKRQSAEVLSKADIEQKTDVILTPQEYEILTKLINGQSYKQIAEAQFLTTDSIKYHAGKIYKKFGISGRSELHSRLH
jgi:DNA-binding NarL/FixJ family response regulator